LLRYISKPSPPPLPVEKENRIAHKATPASLLMAFALLIVANIK
jgi:hypothetical protein